MQSEPLNSWNAFENWIEELESKRKKWQGKYGMPDQPLLYRGQRKSSWHLETTLERFLEGSQLSLAEYYRIIHFTRESIEHRTGRTWDIPTLENHQKWLDRQGGILKEDPQEKSYMAFLRHHRFPSPLLDWTTDPYIAAFFAFYRSTLETDHVSIYILQEWVVGENMLNTWTPNIYRLEGTPHTNSRDFRQRSKYTICTSQEDDKSLSYTPHDWINDQERYPQGMLLKCDIPSSEEAKVKETLDSRGVDFQVLFGTEEDSEEDNRLREFFASLSDKCFP